MKKWRKLIIIAGIALVATGCGSKEEDTIKDEIIHYVEQTNEIADIKNQAIITYNDICAGAEGMDKDELIEGLQTEVLSKLEEYETELAKVTVNTQELEELKKTLQQIVSEQKQDVQDTMEALEGYEPEVIDDINLSIEENKKAYEEYMTQLKDYAQKYNIQITEE
ncbi:MAG: hypothetical protein IJA32_02095 [Lachnospiraceae bacterium]|nr:hypothetical protein [Lachnospiraceae bacterium]